MKTIGYALVILGAYLMGCSNMALYLSRMNDVDVRAGGSGNLGASNAVLLMGWKAGILVAVHDIGKSTLAVILARLLFRNWSTSARWRVWPASWDIFTPSI